MEQELMWRKSTRSIVTGNCVEVATEPRWRKSSRSIVNGTCVEVVDDATGRHHVRDSKDPDGGRLTFGTGAWAAFVAYVKQ